MYIYIYIYNVYIYIYTVDANRMEDNFVFKQHLIVREIMTKR